MGDGKLSEHPAIEPPVRCHELSLFHIIVLAGKRHGVPQGALGYARSILFVGVNDER